MKFRQVLIWGLILVGLSVFIYYYELVGGKQRQEAEKTAKKVFKLASGDVRRMVLSYEGKTVRLEKDKSGKWQLTQPVQAKADDDSANELLQAITGAETDRNIASAGKLADFGLGPAQMVAALTAKDNKSQQLLLGGENPTGSFLYAKLQSNPEVFLVPVSLKYTLKKDVFDLRDKQLIRLATGKVNRLKLRYPNQEIALIKDNLGNWHIAQPQHLLADKDVIEGLISSLNDLQVKKFITESANDLTPYGLDKPEIQIAVNSEDKTEKNLSLSGLAVMPDGGGNSEGIYAKRGDLPQVVWLDADALSKFTKQVFDLRERRILAFDTPEANKLQLIHKGQAISLERRQAGWHMLKPQDSPAKEFLVEGMLFELAQLKAESFLDQEVAKGAAEYGLGQPQLKLDLELEDKTKLSLAVGKPVNAKQVYVQRQDGKAFIVSSDIIQQLAKEPEDIIRPKSEKK